MILLNLSIGEVAGTCSGAVKCVDIARNTDSVGRLLVKYHVPFGTWRCTVWCIADADARKPGERMGLETPVVLAVNDEH